MQQFINDIYSGEVIYRPSGVHSIISDDYKGNSVVEPHDFATASLLDHYALRVPRIRRLIEFSTIAILVLLFMTVQQGENLRRNGQSDTMCA